MKLYIVGQDEKCVCCNYDSSVVYMIAETEEEARQEYDTNEGGFCGNCIAEMLMQEEYEIIKRD